jgi:translocation and assembly module TamA
VLIKVEPGEPVRVGEIALELQGFSVNPELPADKQFDVNALKAAWPLKRARYSARRNGKAPSAPLRSVVQTRYPRAQLVDSQATVDPEAHLANLHVVIDSGPEMRFGELRIEGLKRYPLPWSAT